MRSQKSKKGMLRGAFGEKKVSGSRVNRVHRPHLERDAEIEL